LEDQYEDFVQEEDKNNCPKCGEVLETFDLGAKTLLTCGCSRKLVKK
jgi:transcription initiation factor IIE alpha subunit